MAKFSQVLKQGKNLGIYMSASLIPMALSLITNPWIAKNLPPVDYAIIGYYQGFNTLLTPFINFYLLHYYTKRFFETTDSEREKLRATIFKSLIYFSLILSIIAIGGLYIYTAYFNKDSQISFFPYAIISVMSLPVVGIYSLSLTDFRMQRRSWDFFKLSVSNGILVTFVTLLFVVIFKWGAFGKLSATLMATTAVFIYLLIKNRKLLAIPFDMTTFKTAAKFCSPLVIAAMLTFFSSGYERVVLERMGDLVEMGIYVVGATIAGYISVFSKSIDDTFQPDIFQSIVKKDYKKCFKVISVKVALISIVVIAFIATAPFVIDILTAGRYTSSVGYAQIVAVSSVTSMLYYSFSQVTIAMGYTSITLTNKIIGSILSVIAYTVLINKYGATGAAWGVVLSYIFFFIGNIILVIIKNKIHVTKNIKH